MQSSMSSESLRKASARHFSRLEHFGGECTTGEGGSDVGGVGEADSIGGGHDQSCGQGGCAMSRASNSCGWVASVTIFIRRMGDGVVGGWEFRGECAGGGAEL